MKKYFFTIITFLTICVLIVSFLADNVQGRPNWGTNCEGCHALRGDTTQGITRGAEERVSAIQRQTEMVATIENQLIILKELNKQILDLQAVNNLAKAEGASRTSGLIEALIIERQQTFQDNLNKFYTILPGNRDRGSGQRQSNRGGTGYNNGARSGLERGGEDVRVDQRREGEGVQGFFGGARGDFGRARGNFGGTRGNFEGARGEAGGQQGNVSEERETDEE